MVMRLVVGVTVILMGAFVLWAVEGDGKKDPQNKASAASKSDSTQKDQTEKKSDAAPDRRAEDDDAKNASPDERAIRQIVRKIEGAFNEHDTKTLTSLFSEHGEIIDSSGEIKQGHKAITEVFQNVFERSPEAKMTIQIESIRVLGSAVAIEEGVTRIVHEPGDTEDVARYAVVYSKEGNEWKMISARDLPLEAASDEHLEQLTWLIGDWIDQSDDSVVSTSYRWSNNERYIVGHFRVDTPEEGTMEGSVHIGWDPQLKQLKSWVFDSEGGFATGLWSRNEDTWIVKLNGVLSDGRATSSTYRMKRISGDHAEVESRDRVIGGVLISDGEPVTIVRRAPTPESLSDKD